MHERPEAPWPGGEAGFALWFSGAPNSAELRVTEFWHPDLRDVCELGKRSVVALNSNGQIKWRTQGKAVKALAHFSVCALLHLVQGPEEVGFGYSGCGLMTLYGALRPGSHRLESLKNVFKTSGSRPPKGTPAATPMERVFIFLEGSQKAPILKLGEDFYRASPESKRFPIHVFWLPHEINSPNWSEQPVVDAAVLGQLASVLEREYDPSLSEKETARSLNLVEEGHPLVVAGNRAHRPEDGEDKEGALAPDTGVALVAKRNFLRLLLQLLLGDDADGFTTSFVLMHLSHYVSDEVVEHLPAFSSVDGVVDSCDRIGAVKKSYDKAIRSLGSEWSNLTATFKAGVREYLEGSVLSKDLAHLPPLSSEDRTDLQIQWDDAHCEYLKKKQAALARCRELGFDSVKGEIDHRRIDSVLDVLSDLLEEKVEIDKSYLARAGAGLSKHRRIAIRDRAYAEYCELRLALWDTCYVKYYRDLQRRASDALQSPVGDGAHIVTSLFDKWLMPLKARWDNLIESLGVPYWGKITACEVLDNPPDVELTP